MNQYSKKNGFTLIELILSMSFISVLLLAIAMTVIQISNIYNRGLTLKSVNQAGRSVGYELQRGIAQVLPFNISSGAGSRYIANDWGGRLCIGQYSYIWNYGDAIEKGDSHRNQYIASPNEIRFIKVIDTNAYYCTNPSHKIDHTKSVELLSAGEHNLAMHSFTILSGDSISDSKTKQRLYNIKFTLGTNNQTALDGEGEDINCRPPSDPFSDPAYCSINQFKISVLAGSSVQ